MRTLLAGAGVLTSLMTAATGSTEPALIPGLYQVEVRIGLPNVQDTATPMIVTRCLSAGDLDSGQAFFVLSDNPLKSCELLDYHLTSDAATYRIVCRGPNMGSAVATFETSNIAYRGIIKMNMGGKNMTMSETQLGKRVGDCQ
jgi:uncharacterized protein DUF3617